MTATRMPNWTLQNGRIDAVFGDTAVVTEWLKSNPKLAPVGDKVTDKDYFGTKASALRFVRAIPSCSRNLTLRWKK
ncbi:ABC transporter arginine-binding protein 2 (plasmid) [Klebsiella aerogenes]|nr:ABC transporter arginine-binding protein 2 [Klebsiella aerogenes]